MEDLIKRIEIRLPQENNRELLEELLKTSIDRINLRLGVNELPELFKSICVDVVVKLYRRIYFEGISSENADTLQTSFVDDVLSEYNKEFDRYIELLKEKDLRYKKVVRFI